jgi:hypothetical protein
MEEIKQKIRYDNELLYTICKDNNLVLLKDYSNTKMNRDIKIICKCITHNCSNTFIKSFRDLIRVANFGCKYCANIIRKTRLQETSLTKYGVDSPLKSKEVRQKIQKTFMDKYGYETPSKSPSVIEKIKNTCVQKYGFVSPLKNENIKEKSKQTCLDKYGVDNPRKLKQTIDKQKITNLVKYGFYNQFQNEEIKNKIKNTNIIKYGCQYSSQNQEVKQKMKNTNLERYGVEYAIQNEKFKEKSKKTCLKKYGVEFFSQNIEIMEKISKNAYKLKEYKMPSGNIIKVQGYEPYALDYLIKDNILEDDIKTGCKNVPTIWYEDEQQQKHRHYVDIFIPSQNKCIEIKSTWTAKQKKNNIFIKQQTAKDLGYNYEIWIYDGKGNRIETIL